jgi:hypothetical protein
MKRFILTLTGRPDESRSTMRLPVFAYFAFHAMQVAQARWEGWFAVSAE